MSFGNEQIITGNVVRDPEARSTQRGHLVANFTVAHNPPKGPNGEERDATFLNVVAFDTAQVGLATNVVNTITKGMRVVVSGRIQSRTYESKKYHDSDGNPAKITAHELVADDIGPSLKWASADVQRNAFEDAVQADAVPVATNEEPF